MGTRITIDRVGRIVLPKPVRDALDLAPGDALELETAGEQITLRPVRTFAPLTNEQGVWVFRTGQPLAIAVVDEVLREVRDGRDRQNLDPQE